MLRTLIVLYKILFATQIIWFCVCVFLFFGGEHIDEIYVHVTRC